MRTGGGQREIMGDRAFLELDEDEVAVLRSYENAIIPLFTYHKVRGWGLRKFSAY